MKPTFKQRLLSGSIFIALAAPSAYSATATFNTPGTTNWVCPPGVTSVQVECWGGGGAGGAGRKDSAGAIATNGGGGGGGSYASSFSVPVIPGLSYTVTIPPAAVSGSNGTNVTNAGAVNGASVTFVGESGVTTTASGGSGGLNRYVSTGNPAASGAAGGAGGTITLNVGDVKFAGGAGSAGIGTATNVSGSGGGGAGNANPGGAAVTGTSTTTAGAGGLIGGGAGGQGSPIAGNATPSVAGSPGATPGGGGGGAKQVNTGTTLGGTGGLGQITITYDGNPTLVKDNNTFDLNLPTSWVGGLAVPGATDIAKWDGTVTGPNTTVLGGDTTWAGLKISNPAGLVTINAAPAHTLTLGAAPVDIDMSTATQDLNLNSNLALGGSNFWDVANGKTLTLGGVVSGSSPVIKAGGGTAILSGPNTYTGTTTVSAGTLVAAGGSASTGIVTVGNRSGNAVLNVPLGGTQTGTTSLTAGTLSGAFGAVNISGGTLTTTADSDSSAFGATDGGYGAFTMSSGTFTQPRFMFGGIGSTTTGGAVGVGLITGGTVNTNNWFILSRNAASTGILTVTGGVINHSGAANNLVLGLSGSGRAELNVTGGVIDNSGRTLNMGGSGSFHWTGTGVLNLNGGTVLTNSVVYDANAISVTSNSYVNFSGGTLKTATASASFLPAFASAGSGINRVFINGPFGAFLGGATIDTNGFNSTISANLLAPTGNGVTSLSLDAQGSGYIGAPAVKILDDGLPSTATAYAVVETNSSSPDFGKVTSVVITNPGVILGTASVSLVGGGGSGAAVSVASTSANSSGGLTKIGNGTLTLSGANTYTGATTVSTGTLKSATGSSTTSDITVAGGAAGGVLVAATDGQWTSTGDLTLNNNSTLVIDYGTATPSTTAAPIVVDNFVVGTNLGLMVEAATFSGLAVSQSYPLVTWTTNGPANGSAFTSILTAHLNGTFSVVGSTLFLTVTYNAAGLPITWNTGNGTWDTVATNWLDSNVPPTATAFTNLQDAVIFGDATGATGNPIVTLNSTLSPASVTMNSASRNYTITGTGGIGGTGGLMLPADNMGTLTLETANTYTGGTVINGGILKLSNAGTPGAAGSIVSIGSTGLLDLNGTNQSISFSAGSGVGTVANNFGSGTSTLTLSADAAAKVIIQDFTTTSGGKVAIVIAVTNQGLSNSNTYSGGTTVNAGTWLYLSGSSPLGAGTGTINLPSFGGTTATSSGLVVDGATYANDITGAGFVHSNANSGATVVTTTFTGNINTSGPFLFRAGTGIVYDFAGNGTTSTLSGVIGSTTSMVNGAVTSGSIIKSGSGTLTLSGENLYSGSTTVKEGILNLTGNRTATAGNITVGNLVGSTGTLNVSNGTFQTGTFAVGVGDNTAVGIVNQSGGILTVTGTQMILGNGGAAGTLSGNGGNGTYHLSGGRLTATSVANRGVMLGTNDGGTSTFKLSGTGELLLTGALSQLMVGRADAPAINTTNVFEQTGGTASVSILTIGGAAAAATGLSSTFTVTGGTFNATSFAHLGAGDAGVVTMNIGGTADVTLPDFPTTRGAGTSATVNFNGGTLRPLAASATYMGGLTAAYIKAGGANIDTTNGGITITQGLLTDGSNGGLTKAGINTLTLAGVNTYSGNTTVSNGVLSLGTINPNNEGSAVSIAAGGAQLELTFGGTDTIGKLVVGATEYTSGTFGHSVSGATNGGLGVGALDTFFAAGSGTLTVGAGGYAAWAATNAPTGTPGDDFDGDGVTNGVEYVLGGDKNTNDLGKLPTISTSGGNMVFSFKRDQDSVDGTTSVMIEVGTTLATWPSSYTVGADTAGSTPGVVVAQNSPTPGTDTVTLTVLQAPDAKKFARLKVIP